jgi:hypothetical protein
MHIVQLPEVFLHQFRRTDGQLIVQSAMAVVLWNVDGVVLKVAKKDGLLDDCVPPGAHNPPVAHACKAHSLPVLEFNTYYNANEGRPSFERQKGVKREYVFVATWDM